MITITKSDKLENLLILIISIIIIVGVLIYIFVLVFSNNEENGSNQLSCIINQCKININTGTRTCPDDGETIMYDIITEICTNRNKCPPQFPCIDNGSWIDCSNGGNCLENDPNCSCYNFGQCAKNISMAWKFGDEFYYNFNNGKVNNKIYGIPIYPYSEYTNGLVSCRIDISNKNLVAYQYCISGKYTEDLINGFICCSYNDSCIYEK